MTPNTTPEPNCPAAINTRDSFRQIHHDRIFSIEKAQKELGFNPQVNPTEGIEETVQWYQQKNLI